MDYKEKFLQLVDEKHLEEAQELLEKYKINAVEDPFYYANMGWILNHLECYGDAELSLLKGLRLFPNDGWMISQLGFCHNRLGRIAEGIQELLKALAMGFDEPWIHGEIGWCYKAQEEYDKAIEYFENALLEEPDNPWLLSQAAATYMNKDDKKTAEEYFLKSYRIEPDVDAHIDLANFYHSCGEYDKEIEILEKIDVEEHVAWKAYQIGLAKQALKQYSQAIECFIHALELGKDDTNVHCEIADCYRELDDLEKSNVHYNKALSYYEKALIKEEDTYWIYQEMIWIAHKQKDWDKKLRYLKRGEKVKKDDPWFMYHFARTYSDLHDYEHAENACEFCITHGEHQKDMFDLYAYNLGRNKNELKAIKILHQRIQEFGEDAWVYGEIGWDYVLLQDYEKALKNFYLANGLDKTNPLHISLIGLCFLQEERYIEALDALLQAKALGRDDGWLYATLAQVYDKSKDYIKAIQCLEKMIAFEYDVTWAKKEIKRLEKELSKKIEMEG